MKIKPLPRVLYRNNPLVEVIAQVRFPTQFGMRTVAPADFQASLGGDYPVVFVEQMRGVSVAFEDGAQVQQASDSFNTYHFDSLDGNWRISLCHDFVALSCRKYSEWPDFQKRLSITLQNFRRCYSNLGAFNRIGLRYRDVIVRESLGLTNVSWTELLAPWVVGIYGADSIIESGTIEGGVDLTFCQNILNLGSSKIGLLTGLAQNPDGQRGFVIDADFFMEGLHEWNLEDLEQKFIALHGNAGHLFNHCITPRLHDALSPVDPSIPVKL